jgi:hypothetical protein
VNVKWTPIHTFNNEPLSATGWGGAAQADNTRQTIIVRSFACENNTTLYNAYRLNITANHQSSPLHVQLSLWEMQGYGVAPESMLMVEGSPVGVGKVEPSFGQYNNVASGSNFTASATAVWTNLAENTLAVPPGWEVFEWDDGLEVLRVRAPGRGGPDFMDVRGQQFVQRHGCRERERDGRGLAQCHEHRDAHRGAGHGL